MKAIIVTRFSDEKQKGGTSTEVQEQTCRSYCADHQYEIIGIKKFQAQSAKASNTERVKLLLEFCKKYRDRADVLVVYKLDRFARDVGLHYFIKSELLKLNIILRSATEPIDDSPAGKFTENMLAAVAQFDNDQKTERVNSAMRNKLEKGIWQWRVPLGYKNMQTDRGKSDIAKVVEGEAQYAKKIFNWYASGQMGISEISEAMQGTGLIHQKGQHKGKPIKFSPQTIHNILTNEFYIGIMHVKTWDERFDGAHETFIDAKTWEACQARLNPPKKEDKMTRKQINPDFPLRDNLICGYCDRKMTAAWTQGKLQKYAYYYCGRPDCSNPGTKTVGKTEFENEFMEFLNKLEPSKELQREIHDRLLVRYKQRQDEFETDASRQRKRLNQLEKKKQNLVEAIADGFDKEDIAEALKKIKQEIGLVKLALNESHTGEFEMELMLDYADKFFGRMAMLWNDAPLKQKVQLQRTLFPDGIIYSYEEGGFSNTKLRPYIGYMWEAKASSTINVSQQSLSWNTYSQASYPLIPG